MTDHCTTCPFKGCQSCDYKGGEPSMETEWRPWLDGYTVSKRGDIHSTKSGRILKPQHRHQGGYVTYHVRVEGKGRIVYAHSLVLEVFVGPRPEGFDACHLDGNPKNNALANLMWGSRSTNGHQRVGHGRHLHANKTECPNGHPYDEANTYMAPRGDGSRFRQCRECTRANGRAYRARQRAMAVES